jgi:ribulose kinase
VSKKYAIGVDYGTESGRAVLVDVSDGREVATAVHPYPLASIRASTTQQNWKKKS